MKFSIFDKKIIEVIRKDGKWFAYYLGNEGKKRAADGLVIPSSVKEAEIEDYLADVFHELATISNNEIKRL